MEIINKSDYLGGKQAATKLGVHQRTLYLWEQKGLIKTIRTPGNKRLYNVVKFLEEKCKNVNICDNLEVLDGQEKLNIWE